MSSNFDFLQTITDPDYLRICANLYKVCTGAEMYLYDDPDTCMDRCRVAIEKVTQLLYFKQFGDFGRKNLFEISNDKDFKVKVYQFFGNKGGEQLLNDIHRVRIKGNEAHHGDVIKNPILTASMILRKTHRIIVKVLKKLGFIQSVPSYTEPVLYTRETETIENVKGGSSVRPAVPASSDNLNNQRDGYKNQPEAKTTQENIVQPVFTPSVPRDIRKTKRFETSRGSARKKNRGTKKQYDKQVSIPHHAITEKDEKQSSRSIKYVLHNILLVIGFCLLLAFSFYMWKYTNLELADWIQYTLISVVALVLFSPSSDDAIGKTIALFCVFCATLVFGVFASYDQRVSEWKPYIIVLVCAGLIILITEHLWSIRRTIMQCWVAAPYINQLMKDVGYGKTNMLEWAYGKAELKKQLLDQMDLNIYRAMTDEQLDELEALLDAGASAKVIEQFIRNTGIDFKKIVKDTVIAYRANQLEISVENAYFCPKRRLFDIFFVFLF